MTEKMNVHKALSELKVLDDRILKSIMNTKFAIANKHSNEKISGVDLKQYTTLMKSDYDSAVKLIARRAALKRAVVLSNAVTQVEIDGKKYTIAEAIEMKNHGMELKQELLDKMKVDLAKAKSECDRRNGDALDASANEYIKSIFGTTDMKNGLSDEATKKRAEFIELQTYELVDPLNVEEKIKALDEEISAFMSEVDAALSVSNAITEIEFEY